MSVPEVLHAIVLADGPHAGARVVGLTLRERGKRVAGRAGASRVLVLDDAGARAQIAAWWRDGGGGGALLVIRAHDQLVHTPLVAGLVGSDAERAVAVVPPGAVATDVAAGQPAGALLARGAAADALVAALAAGDDDRALADTWLRDGAAAIPHGEVARHPTTTGAERKAAARLLYRIVHKPQDNIITRYLYRPLSFPLTRLAVHTPITPNQVSYLTAIIVGLGVWLTARGSMNSAIAGTLVILAASYVDCVDGEIARLKLLSSKFGAWLDTIVDELSTVAQMVALGWHCHLWFGPRYFGDLGFDPWLVAMWIGLIFSILTIYVIYYNIIVVVGSANSQDYVGRFEVVDAEAPNTVRLRPVATKAIQTDKKLHPAVDWLATYLPYMIRRDFVCWALVFLSLIHWTHFAFLGIALGALFTGSILALDHLRLRAQRRAIARAGQVLVT